MFQKTETVVCFAKIFSVTFSIWLIFFYCSETINKERKQKQCIGKDWISALKTLRADLRTVMSGEKCSNASLSKFHSSDQRIKVLRLPRKFKKTKIPSFEKNQPTVPSEKG